MGPSLLFVNILIAFAMMINTLWADDIEPGPFTQQQCVACHKVSHPQLVEDWHKSSHANVKPAVGCHDCHSNKHGNSPSSRQNSTCIRCHGSFNKEAIKSYELSKHGIISKIEARQWDWSQPLADGNYRSPTCAYCHLHDGDHTMGGKKTELDPGIEPTIVESESAMERRISPCYDCHSPRFAATWFKSGEAMVAIGRMKYREGAEVAKKIEQLGRKRDINKADSLLTAMKKKHLQNIRLGIFHQSPDHQWWHGQPALDGDLLRLKGVLGDLKREKQIDPW
ncbi:MAG: hypothetical protein HQL69_07670 [Magnetococcales bacterium]|nr:hypothetical protein [Magnetococcales bacterium]